MPGNLLVPPSVTSLKPVNNQPQKSAAPPSQTDMHAALMSQLLKGRQLNHVDPEKRNQRPTKPAQTQDDPRTALMNQIKAGVKLKTVSTNQPKPESNTQPASAGSGLAVALAKALQERGKVLQHTDESSSSDGEDDEDEWDDAN